MKTGDHRSLSSYVTNIWTMEILVESPFAVFSLLDFYILILTLILLFQGLRPNNHRFSRRSTGGSPLLRIRRLSISTKTENAIAK